MTDEIKTDTEKSLEHVDAVIKSDGLKVKASISGWAKAHTSWLVGLVCLVVGLVLGHLHK